MDVSDIEDEDGMTPQNQGLKPGQVQGHRPRPPPRGRPPHMGAPHQHMQNGVSHEK